MRAAVVRVHTKDGKTTLLRRPLKCLYPLECNIGDGEERTSGKSATTKKATGDETVDKIKNKDVVNELSDPQLQPGTRARPMRRAARRANEFIDAVMSSEQ